MEGISNGGERGNNCKRKFFKSGKRAQDTVHRTAKDSSLVLIKAREA